MVKQSEPTTQTKKANIQNVQAATVKDTSKVEKFKQINKQFKNQKQALLDSIFMKKQFELPETDKSDDEMIAPQEDLFEQDESLPAAAVIVKPQFQKTLSYEYMVSMFDDSETHSDILQQFNAVRMQLFVKHDPNYYFSTNKEVLLKSFNLLNTRPLQGIVDIKAIENSMLNNAISISQILDQCYIEFFVFKQGDSQFSIKFRYYILSSSLWMICQPAQGKTDTYGKTYKSCLLLHNIQQFFNKSTQIQQFDALLKSEQSNQYLLKPSLVYGLLLNQLRQNFTYKF